jgi:hypothetical protein
MPTGERQYQVGNVGSGARVTQGNNITIIETINKIDLTNFPEFLKAFSDREAISRGLLEEATRKRDEIAAKLDITEGAVGGFFETLHEQRVPPEQLRAKLIEIALRFEETRQRLAALDVDDPVTKVPADKAQIELDEGRTDAASVLLQRVEEADLAAAAKAREIAKQASEVADARQLNAARAREGRGDISLTQLHYGEAADHFQKAADLVPPRYADERARLLLARDIAAFAGIDPVRGEAALVGVVAAGPGVLDAVLRRATSAPQHRIRLKKLCAQLGEPAIPHLLDAIRNGPWGVKLNAAPCFAAFRGDKAAQEGLRALLQEWDFDIRRLAIEGIGYAGYSDIREDLVQLAKYDELNIEGDDYSMEKVSPISDYSMGKLSSYVIEALLRSFTQEIHPAQIEHFEQFAELCLKERQDHLVDFAIERAIKDLTPRAADVLVARWLRHEQQRYRMFALSIIADRRLQGTIEEVISVLLNPDEDEDVRRTAGITLGEMASDGAAHGLAMALTDDLITPGIDWAFSTLYAHPIAWPDCSLQIKSALSSSAEIRQGMLLSLGLRREMNFRQDIERGLFSNDPYLRGTSGLAFAHLLGPEALDMLKERGNDAKNDVERVFALSAQIHAGCNSCADALDEALQGFQPLGVLRLCWKRQVLWAMVRADHGSLRSQLWVEIAGETMADISRHQRLRSSVATA